MSPLAAVLGLLAATVAGGSFFVAAIVLGLWGGCAILVGLTVAAVAAALLGSAVEAAIKRADPAWDAARDRPDPMVAAVRHGRDPRRFDPGRHWRR